ncbi:MAG: hypothetical protein L0H79_07195 [Intrasporangium sp.]|uniref:hypothetical protein n=1 Tax=Intrasporangium sp. TaxID=1925024 RepID=UPI00264A4DEB|nr:hypothetical protein [Intrasporangium sp.]MDN5795524.1 hypothetical protein [Intrasporangium sp.]
MDVLGWLNEWTQTPGFAGIAAVIAAVIAYRGVRRTNRNDADLAAANQWWDQARWASERLSGDSKSAAIGLAAFDQLLEVAPGTKAAGFVRAAMRSLIETHPPTTESALPRDLQTGRINQHKAAQLYVAASRAAGAPIPEHIEDLAASSE